MTGGYDLGHPGDHPGGRPKVYRGPFSDTSTLARTGKRERTAPTSDPRPRDAGFAFVGSMPSQVAFTRSSGLHSQGPLPTKTHGQAPHNGQIAPHDQPSPNGQMPPQEYYSQSSTKHIMPHGQIFGGPPNAGRSAYPTSQLLSGGQVYGGGPPVADQRENPVKMVFSRLKSPRSSAYRAGPRQRYEAYHTASFPFPNRPQRHGAHGRHSLESDVPPCVTSQRVSSGPDLGRHQPVAGNDHSPLRAAKASAFTKDRSSSAISTEHNLSVEDSFNNATMSLRAVAQGSRVFEGLEMEDHHIQRSVDYQLISLQPAVQSGKNEHDGEEDGNTATLYSSLDLTASGTENDDEHSHAHGETDEKSHIRAAKSRSEDGLDLVDKYAFNFGRKAYNHRVPQHLTKGTTIHVGSLAALNTSLKQRRKGGHNDSTPPLLPHPNEFQKGQKTIECVWIGMLPSPAAVSQIHSSSKEPIHDAGGEESPNKLARKRVKKPSTVAEMREDEMRIIDFDRNALRVVAKKSYKVTKETHVYALLQSPYSSGLQGFKVGIDDVFFFREFRDDSTKSIIPRKQATMARIRARIFRGDTLSLPQSPVPTTKEFSDRALSPLSSLSDMSTPTPPPGMFDTQDPGVALNSPKISTDDTVRVTPNSSGISSNDKVKKATSLNSKKRKSQAAVVDVLMGSRDEVLKKARMEGCCLFSPCTSDLRESIENDDPNAQTGHLEDYDGRLMNRASAYFVDIDEPADHTASVENDMGMNNYVDGNEYDEAYSEHAVDAEDPGFLDPTDDLIRELARADKKETRGFKTVSFRGHSGQVIHNNDKVINSSNSVDREDYDGDHEPQATTSSSLKESASLVQKIKALVIELATRQDVVGLQQALAMVECVQSRDGPPKTSALGLYLNVPNSKDVSMETCAEQLNQLRALFQGIDDENKIQDHVLAWMIKGLQITGQSLSIDILRPCLTAFAEQYKTKFGDAPNGQRSRMSRNVLVDMICRARDKAEEVLRLVAIERGADRASMEVEDECPSHPYFDPDEEFVYQPTIWERPEE